MFLVSSLNFKLCLNIQNNLTKIPGLKPKLENIRESES